MFARVRVCFLLVRKREGERESLKCGRACFMLVRVRTPSSPVKEREKERKKERERKRKRERKRERDK